MLDVRPVEPLAEPPCTVVRVAHGFQLWLMPETEKRLLASPGQTMAMWVHDDGERIWFVTRPFRPGSV